MRKIVFTLALLILTNTTYSWSLKTHIWIAQQVLNDVLDDGMLTILNRNYPVPPHIVNALRNHPDRFRMGSLGPDVFPDPIVGQTTTHPGVVGGWQTDNWLKHLLVNATTPEEIAFSYGFAIHACSDIFAHTYVNAYAGDIFLLTDGERDVENRHFVLEKYIERLTPEPKLLDGTTLNLNASLGVPSSYVSKKLILDRDVFKQNLKAQSSAHLASMFAVRVGVEKLNNTTNDLIGKLSDFGADYFKKQLKLQADLASGKVALSAAEKTLDAELKVLALKRQGVETALKILAEAKDIIAKYPELISVQNTLYIQQAKIAVDATAESLKVASEVAKTVNSLENKINDLRGSIASFACNLILWPPAVKKCKQAVDNLNDEISGIQKVISGHKLRAEVAKKAAQIAIDKRDGIKRELDRLQNIHNKAISGIADKSYETAVFAANLELKSQEVVVEKQKDVVVKAKAFVERISDELDKINPIIDELNKAVKKYNLISLLIGNWLNGIDKASNEYIKASHQAGLKMLANNGNPLEDYKKWFSCYGQVFIAQPHQIGEAGCLVEENLDKIKEEYNKLIDSLPNVLKWLLFPTRQATKKAYKELEPGLKKAEFSILKFLTDPTTAEFLMLLADPKSATQEKLTSIYKKDDSGKRLLLFDDVSSFVKKDLLISNGLLNTDKFSPLVNSVTLSKLALLNPAALNQLIRDNVGDYKSSLLGAEIYKSDQPNYCLLFEAVRSIDGNHQWQAFGLPYPRRFANQVCSHNHHYGYNYFEDPSKGFKLWIDPFIREKVFIPLFPGPVMGALGERTELKWPFYRYPECAQNPYPSTQGATGNIASSNSVCEEVSNPNVPLITLNFKTPQDFSNRFFVCRDGQFVRAFFTIVSSFESRKSAEKQRKLILAKNPDIEIRLASPKPNYWTVLMATCSSYKIANEARDLAIRRRIAKDAFILSPKVKWDIY